MKHIVRIVALVLVLCMVSLNVFAAENNMVPSVEQKGEPEVVAPKTEVDGKPAVIVETKEDEVVASDEPEVLIITPMAEVKELSPENQEKMEKAFTQIAEAKSLAEVAPELPDVLKELKVETPVEELVVRDLFHIGLSEKLLKALEEEGNHCDITFKMELEENEQLIVLVQNADGEWVIISGEDIIVEDGEITIRFPFVGPVAFIVA